MNLKISVNTLHYPNSDSNLLHAHKSVMNHFSIPVNYYEAAVRHGVWMDHVLANTDADVIGFLDIDCIPLRKDSLIEMVKFVTNNKSIAGVVQASNHLPPFTHTFVAPSCFFIWKPLYDALGRPSFGETHRSDVCEELCYIAEANGVRMKALYPTYFEKAPEEGAWRLNNYGIYGIGTVFAGLFYHLYQSRFKSNIKLFVDRCEQVLQNKFTTEGMHSCLDFNFQPICKYDAEIALNEKVSKKI